MPNRPTRFYSKKQESNIAKAVDGKRTANSGATLWSKGDVTTRRFLIEAKTCTEQRKTFTLHKDWFDKNKEEAFAMHKDYSAVVFSFGDNENHYVISEYLFKRLIELLEKEEDYERQI